MFAGVIIVGLILIVMMAGGRRGGKLLDKHVYQREWLSIERGLSGDSSSQQFAIFQADKLLDRALRERGFSGETMGERMKSARANFSNNEAVWAAHKLRNRVAHEDNVKLNDAWTRKALASFKRGLKDLGAI